jgi:hypothetical protein
VGRVSAFEAPAHQPDNGVWYTAMSTQGPFATAELQRCIGAAVLCGGCGPLQGSHSITVNAGYRTRDM